MQWDWHPTALVTGGTDGIGKAIAVGLARQGFRLIIVGRDPDKGARAASELRTVGRTAEVQYLQADLSLLNEVNRLADEVAKLCQALHRLILGAGTVRGRRW